MSIKFQGMRRWGRTLAEVPRRRGKPLTEKRFGGKSTSENAKHLEEMQYLRSSSLFSIPDPAKSTRNNLLNACVPAAQSQILLLTDI